MTEEAFDSVEYCVFVDREDGPHGIAVAPTADHALTKSALYYYEMNKHPHNNMDMSEIDRFYLRTRAVHRSAMSEERIEARDAVAPGNPWLDEYWK